MISAARQERKGASFSGIAAAAPSGPAAATICRQASIDARRTPKGMILTVATTWPGRTAVCCGKVATVMPSSTLLRRSTTAGSTTTRPRPEACRLQRPVGVERASSKGSAAASRAAISAAARTSSTSSASRRAPLTFATPAAARIARSAASSRRPFLKRFAGVLSEWASSTPSASARGNSSKIIASMPSAPPGAMAGSDRSQPRRDSGTAGSGRGWRRRSRPVPARPDRDRSGRGCVPGGRRGRPR